MSNCMDTPWLSNSMADARPLRNIYTSDAGHADTLIYIFIYDIYIYTWCVYLYIYVDQHRYRFISRYRYVHDVDRDISRFMLCILSTLSVCVGCWVSLLDSRWHACDMRVSITQSDVRVSMYVLRAAATLHGHTPHATGTHSTNMPLATLNGFGCKITYYARTHMHATRSTGYKWLLLTANVRQLHSNCCLPAALKKQDTLTHWHTHTHTGS